jgi:GldM C-terminal domain
MKTQILFFLFLIICCCANAQTKHLIYPIENGELNALIDNSIEVYMPKGDSISISAGLIKVSKIDRGQSYVITAIPDSVRKCIVTFWHKKKAVKQQAFKVKPAFGPPIITYMGANNGSTMSAMQAKVGQGLNSLIPFGGCSLNSIIKSFTLIRVATDGCNYQTYNEGAAFSNEAARIMQMAAPGDMYLFKNIQVKTPDSLVSAPMFFLTIK